MKFYANRTFSLGTCLRLLGNSSRGLNLVYKWRLYLSNIFPIMTYGCQMWMNPMLKGQKDLVKPLLTAHYNACRWITGAFRTTPLGSLDVLAGLIPIWHQLLKLQKRYGLRSHTLCENHPIRDYLVEGRILPKKSPLRGLSILARAAQERFSPLDEECEPGNWILDTFLERFTPLLPHPKKGNTKAFHQWVENTLKKELRKARPNRDSITIHTDGSLKRAAAGAAWIVSRLGGQARWYVRINGATRMGLSISTDTEWTAIERGLLYASKFERKHLSNIYIISDLEEALQTAFSTRKGAGLNTRISICRTARLLFLVHPKLRIHRIWCPSHMGVDPLNDRIDEYAKQASQELLTTLAHTITSVAYAKQQITWKVLEDWKSNHLPLKYGKKCMFPAHFLKPSHTGSKVMKEFGHHRTLMTNAIRVFTNHAPIGSYRARFFPNEDTACPHHGEEAFEDPGFQPPMQDRDHIFLQCNRYELPWAHDKEQVRISPTCWAEYRDKFSLKNCWRHFASFIKNNTSAFTFGDAPRDSGNSLNSEKSMESSSPNWGKRWFPTNSPIWPLSHGNFGTRAYQTLISFDAFTAWLSS